MWFHGTTLIYTGHSKTIKQHCVEIGFFWIVCEKELYKEEIQLGLHGRFT